MPTPSRARSATEERGKGARTRQAILAAAVEHFGTVGRRSAGVPAIARAVGVTPSAVYAYFPTKQALFEAAVDADAAGLIADALPDLWAGTVDLDFELLFARLFGALPAHPLARRVLAGEEGGGADRWVQLPAEARLMAGLTVALRRQQAEGTVRRDIDAATLAAGLEAIVTALIIAVLQTDGHAPPDTSAAVIAVLEASIRPATR